MVGLAPPSGALAVTDSGTGGTAPPQAEPEAPSAPAPAGDMAVSAPRSAYVRDRVRISGRSLKARRRVVLIEARPAGGTWSAAARVRADRKGRFAAVWRPRRAGSYELRARTGATSSAGTGGTAVPLEVGPGGSGSSSYLTVYEPAIATWYGPGFFGSKTACGIELTEATVGVAHRDLPVRDPGADRLRGPHDHRPRHRSRTVREQRRLGPHAGRRRATWHDRH